MLDRFPLLHTACIAQNIDAVYRLVTQMNDSELRLSDSKYGEEIKSLLVSTIQKFALILCLFVFSYSFYGISGG